MKYFHGVVFLIFLLSSCSRQRYTVIKNVDVFDGITVLENVDFVFSEKGIEMSSPSIDPAAQVDPAASVADNVQIGPFCVVGPDVKLGANVVLKSHVVIEGPNSLTEATYHCERF